MPMLVSFSALACSGMLLLGHHLGDASPLADHVVRLETGFTTANAPPLDRIGVVPLQCVNHNVGDLRKSPNPQGAARPFHPAGIRRYCIDSRQPGIGCGQGQLLEANLQNGRLVTLRPSIRDQAVRWLLHPSSPRARFIPKGLHLEHGGRIHSSPPKLPAFGLGWDCFGQRNHGSIDFGHAVPRRDDETDLRAGAIASLMQYRLYVPLEQPFVQRNRIDIGRDLERLEREPPASGGKANLCESPAEVVHPLGETQAECVTLLIVDIQRVLGGVEGGDRRRTAMHARLAAILEAVDHRPAARQHGHRHTEAFGE